MVDRGLDISDKRAQQFRRLGQIFLLKFFDIVALGAAKSDMEPAELERQIAREILRVISLQQLDY